MSSSQGRRRSVLAMAAGMGITMSSLIAPAYAAKDVALVSGGFRRSIPVKEIEHLAETGEAIGLMKNLLDLSGQDPNDVAKVLNQKLNVPLVLTSRLINTRIGDAIVRRVAKIIYPIYTPK